MVFPLQFLPLQNKVRVLSPNFNDSPIIFIEPRAHSLFQKHQMAVIFLKNSGKAMYEHKH